MLLYMLQGMQPTTEGDLAPNINSVTAEETCVRGSCHCLIVLFTFDS